MRSFTALLFAFYMLSLSTDAASGACPSSFDDVEGSCYLVLPDNRLDYLDARTFCLNLGADLAVIKDCNLLGPLSTYLLGFGNVLDDGVWVGASDILVEGTFRWIDDSTVPMGAPFWSRVNAPFFSPEPSGGSNENCAFISTNSGYYFNDGNCEETSGYTPLCQIATGVNDTCPAQYELINGMCFEFLSTIDVTWSDAQDVCLATGGNLATIDDCSVLAAVIAHAESTDKVPTNGYWIGGSDAGQEGNWTWTDGSVMAMGAPFWGRTTAGELEPNDEGGTQDCMMLTSADRYYFADENCGTLLVPLCQVEPLPTTTTAPPTTTAEPPTTTTSATITTNTPPPANA